MKAGHLFLSSFFFALVICVCSCSRQKNTLISRTYHKITARDNGYFNARERIKEGAKKLAESHVDQYDRLLKIFQYADEDKAKAIFPLMDEAIKKASIVVQRHSMEFSGEEKNRWVEESYLLIGKAHFYKHDYWAASETFQFVASSYNKKPVRFEALLWLTKCYLELGKTTDAEYLLDFFKNDKEFPWKELREEYYMVSAAYNIMKVNYEKAAEDLQGAVASSSNKQRRIRNSFILGQVYQKLENCEQAFVVYDQVMKKNAPYEMEFNARINRARCFDVNSGSRDIKARLIKMLADDKNKEYRDQIYYALAAISIKENKEPEAVDHLKSSVAASTVNANQKALSYLELAEIYFKNSDYRAAQLYYDSTITFLTKDHPDYEASLNKKTSLSKLIRNLNTITLQDSLLQLAALSPQQQQAAVDLIIEREAEAQKQKKAEEELLKQQQQQQAEQLNNDAGFIQPGNTASTVVTAGGWYFYNPAAISFGLNEFIKKWGNRKSEDGWRRSTKEMVTATIEEPGVPDEDDNFLIDMASDSVLALGNEERRQIYLGAIPATAEQKTLSEDKIIEAYYNAGLIYKENLNNPDKAASEFETLLKRYPDNKYILPAYYNLYRTYLALKNDEKAEYYKKLILENYPDSEYSRIITNPDYYKENQKKTAILQVFYENTFRAFRNGQYQDVITRKSTADSLFPPNALTPKFELLKALSIGKTRPLPEFEASLKNIIINYPLDSVSARAREMLSKITMTETKEITTDVLKPAQTLPAYRYVGDTTQFFVLLYASNTLDANDLINKFSDYNNLYYGTSDLEVSNSVLGTEKQMIMVRAFKNGQEGKNYLTGVTQNADVFEDIDLSTVQTFLVSPDNLLLLMQNKNLSIYEDFYNKNYPR